MSYDSRVARIAKLTIEKSNLVEQVRRLENELAGLKHYSNCPLPSTEEWRRADQLSTEHALGLSREGTIGRGENWGANTEIDLRLTK